MKLTKIVVDPQGGPDLSCDGPGEFRCDECGSRCTRGPSGVEYGHGRAVSHGKAVRCSRRPDVCDPTETGSYYTDPEK